MAHLTNALFSDLLECEYKAFLKCRGERGIPSEFESVEAERSRTYSAWACKHLLGSDRPPACPEADIALADALNRQDPVLTNVLFVNDSMSIRFDALMRGKKGIDGRPPAYFPILFCHRARVRRKEKLLLALCGLALAESNGEAVPMGKVLYGAEFCSTRVKLSPMLGPARSGVERICTFQDVETQPLVRLNSHCAVCEFESRCRKESEEKDDLSLLRGLSSKEITKLHRKGIFTVTQYSYTFRPRRRNRRGSTPTRHDHALHALAVRTNKIHVADTPEIPSTNSRLYVDVEGDPDRDFYYLIGVVAVGNGTDRTYAFWADDESEERRIWMELATLLRRSQDATLFHYGSYESTFFKRMKHRYGQDARQLECVLPKCCNILSAIWGHVYFPTYTNGLKDIAASLGFRWTVDRPSAIRSLVWRHRWETTRDEPTRQALLTYNREDCLALKVTTEALERIRDQKDFGPNASVVLTETLRANERAQYGKVDFFFPELDRINECAYYDYQRTRVHFRTSPSVKKALRRERRSMKRRPRVNKEVTIPRPDCCPTCHAENPYKHQNCSTTTYDLQIINGGVKRWVVRYHSGRFLCTQCRSTFSPNAFREVARWRYGHAVIAWDVYQNIVLRNSHGETALQFQDVFGYPVSRALAAYFKKRAADYYEPVYRHLCEGIRSGGFVHVDETKVTVLGPGRKTVLGYVWVFSNLKEVVYVYNHTREGKCPRKVLQGFKGVLVSDFFSAYDGMDCKQQKCLIHLIRDINNDLFKNQTDAELVGMCKAFSMLLKPIIETVDQHGLKRYYLQRHKPAVRGFFDEVLSVQYSSEVAQAYQKRFKKYRDKLFVFLDCDGVAWNNNAAEHAVKQFAYLRRVIGSSSSVSGIQRYLILLSLIETLRLRGIRPLTFLVSGSLDVDGFDE